MCSQFDTTVPPDYFSQDLSVVMCCSVSQHLNTFALQHLNTCHKASVTSFGCVVVCCSVLLYVTKGNTTRLLVAKRQSPHPGVF